MTIMTETHIQNRHYNDDNNDNHDTHIENTHYNNDNNDNNDRNKYKADIIKMASMIIMTECTYTTHIKIMTVMTIITETQIQNRHYNNDNIDNNVRNIFFKNIIMMTTMTIITETLLKQTL